MTIKATTEIDAVKHLYQLPIGCRRVVNVFALIDGEYEKVSWCAYQGWLSLTNHDELGRANGILLEYEERGPSLLSRMWKAIKRMFTKPEEQK